MRTIQVTVADEFADELEYLAKLHRQHGPAIHCDNVQDLISRVIEVVAEGSRRPDSWERGLLEKMGLVANCAESYTYRATYGDPAKSRA